MDMIMTLGDDPMPFVMQNVPESECLRAVEVARSLGFEFDKNSPSTKVTDTLIRLHGYEKKRPKKRRLYVYGDGVLLETDTSCPEEKEPTKALLAYEKDIDASLIHIIELEK